MKRLTIISGVFSLCMILFFAPLAEQSLGQEKYPARTIKFLVPYAAGGQTDVVCRKIVHLAKESIGQDIIVENKVGASGLVTASFIAKSKPDGYTLGAIPTTPFVISPFVGKIDFDPLTAFNPIAQIFTGNQMLAVGKDSQIKTFKDFIEEGHKRQVTVASTGFGLSEMALRRMASAAKINMRVVPFEGSAPAVMATIGGQVDAFCGGGSYEHIKAGSIRVIARLSPENRGSVKGAPSLKELGYDAEAPEFLGIFAPKGLPEPVQKKLEEEFSKALHNPEIAELIENVGSSITYRNSKDFQEHVRKAYEQARKEFQEQGLGIYAKDKK
jgi:tripartite-type tricarboxylate transporter receptor subunit TctC